jgi:hypothetical protein
MDNLAAALRENCVLSPPPKQRATREEFRYSLVAGASRWPQAVVCYALRGCNCSTKKDEEVLDLEELWRVDSAEVWWKTGNDRRRCSRFLSLNCSRCREFAAVLWQWDVECDAARPACERDLSLGRLDLHTYQAVTDPSGRGLRMMTNFADPGPGSDEPFTYEECHACLWDLYATRYDEYLALNEFSHQTALELEVAAKYTRSCLHSGVDKGLFSLCIRQPLQ